MRNIHALFVAVLAFVASHASAITCPPFPDIGSKTSDIHSEVRAALGALGKAKIADVSVKTDVVMKNIFEKFPNVDELVRIQMASSVYCQLLNESKSLTDSKRLNLWENFQKKNITFERGSASGEKKVQEGVSLNGSYPGEVWKVAQARDFSWLADEWCYPSLPGFVTRFRTQGGRLYRQNESGPSKYMKTNWIPIQQIYLSNRDVFRLAYPKNQEWPVDFIQFQRGRTTEWREYQRGVSDDGSVTSMDKKLVLSCRRCNVDQQGIAYDCKD